MKQFSEFFSIEETQLLCFEIEQLQIIRAARGKKMFVNIFLVKLYGTLNDDKNTGIN